ncbi:glycerate kinase [Lentibacter algarum]|uniref:glycerate kinase type-2 family protein n=1 Tax=Lentibacter algarum TaxID=576131 RepID=UPI001C07770B|nr:glycerate kinase [Lentibacter algarum]MBU2981279.1 glycerate kinase [Lentibacter algarum]
MDEKKQAFLTELFDVAIAAADPLHALAGHLPDKPKGRCVVVGAGKGAAQLAAAFEVLWRGDLSGVVVTRYGFGCACERIEVLEAAHPVPDAAGLSASEAMFAAVEDLGPDDLVVALVCGGGSALLAGPAEGLEFADEVELNHSLLASGAPIGAMNAIRKMTSRVKGGRLAAATKARVVTLVVSDVPGDDPAQVASGPTVPCASGRAEALAAIERYKIALPERVLAFLQDAPEPPLPSDTVFEGNEVHVVASAAVSLAAAAERARKAGVAVTVLGDALEGEARELGAEHAQLACEATPQLILSGGETTVTLTGKGRGGRNTEYLLSFALAIEGRTDICALAADSDGIDGSEDNAGAFADGEIAEKMRAAGVDPVQALASNDAYTAFEAAQTLFTPGPTGTNVNDFRAILIGEL